MGHSTEQVNIRKMIWNIAAALTTSFHVYSQTEILGDEQESETEIPK
jgi:hypothetical protein